MRRIARHRERNAPLQRLVRTALRHGDTDKAWRAITALQFRGNPQTLAIARALCRSGSWRRRELGCRIAAQLRQRHGRDLCDSSEYAIDETRALLFDALHDPHEAVVRAAVSGAGHRPFDRALPELIRLSRHANAEMRWSVAIALGGGYPQGEAIDTLLRLATDDSAAVRDWATFGIGEQSNADSDAIREMLWHNLADADEDVRGEALVGLAKRQDARVVDTLMRALKPDAQVYSLMAAETLASPSLLDALLRIRAVVDADNDVDAYWLNRLEDAIAACTPAGDRAAP